MGRGNAINLKHLPQLFCKKNCKTSLPMAKIDFGNDFCKKNCKNPSNGYFSYFPKKNGLCSCQACAWHGPIRAVLALCWWPTHLGPGIAMGALHPGWSRPASGQGVPGHVLDMYCTE